MGVTALRAIKKSLVDPNKNLSSWNRGDPCTSDWTGVVCLNRISDDGYLHVQQFDLSNNNLTGTIPANFSGLPVLQKLSIANNSLSGSIPATIWQNRASNGNERLIVLKGNPLCSSTNLVQFCGSGSEDQNNGGSSTSDTSDCPGCPPPYQYSSTSPIRCFCAAPLLVGYRLKSPGFSDFLPYRSMFEEYLTTGLELVLNQLNLDSFAWEEGPRLKMFLKLFPVYNAYSNDSFVFNTGEVKRIMNMFTSWQIPDSDIFGPYELLNFTLLSVYSDVISTSSSSSLSKGALAGIVLGAIAGAVALSAVVSLLILRGRMKNYQAVSKSRRRVIVHWIVRRRKDAKKDQINADDIMRNFGSVAPKRYTYSDVKRLTNSFKDKIGQGGYGAVYKGKLPDGHIVAVKVLSESKGNGEDFVNEVASISQTSHVNVVALLGFCYQNSKRAIIYEFISNGSLDKFIYTKESSATHLDSKTMFKIAIGVARGLEYLHRGCRTRILHFDIKPQNILLDEEMCPKISDFGLAKLCKTKESIVSMMGIRGTVGYIAPEVFSRNFGGVSHKSDVYSYGMLVLEMVGERKILNNGVSHSSEMYFPQGIYRKLEQGERFGTFEDTTEEEEDIVKKMIIVSLWCIQTNPLDRPSMDRVIEMLEGTLQSLQVPPKPFLDSPANLPLDSSNSSATIENEFGRSFISRAWPSVRRDNIGFYAEQHRREYTQGRRLAILPLWNSCLPGVLILQSCSTFAFYLILFVILYVSRLLSGNQLTGPLPEELGYLPNLDRIQIDQNNISGPLPVSFSYLNKTKHLDLSSNQLNGSIPPDRPSKSITTIDLSNNNLTGTIPANFSSLPVLQKLSIANNSLSGSIPATIWQNRASNGNQRLIVLKGNPLCSSTNLVQFCGSGSEDQNNGGSSTSDTSDCPGCPPPYQYSSTSPIRCFCAAPLLVGYQLKQVLDSHIFSPPLKY
ncbi:hypothetical protein CJ030_MR5G023735 [Morella rubra]|uniref:Protein kinase domain-containing protein n=1 Tax=Morella rubra TaxID=262757 RepID=A0A6A1VJ42_9ROSI|nr:hypothetical protein CJ030_MR5G023735 [Morella rubra]